MDARKEPSTPTMTVYLEPEYGIDRDKAREVSWQIEAAPLHEFGDITTDMENMQVVVHLNTKVCEKRKISPAEIMEVAPKKIRDRRHYRDFEHDIDEAKATLIFTPKDRRATRTSSSLPNMCAMSSCRALMTSSVSSSGKRPGSIYFILKDPT